MNKLLIALGLTLAAATSASAGALDAYNPPVYQGGAAIDYTATASVGTVNELENRARLGDGSPSYEAPLASSGIDYTATASIGANGYDNGYDNRARLGDGSPMFLN